MGGISLALNSGEQASAYEAGGAAAVSVLTEPDYFGGSVADLLEVVSVVRLPALRKDFCVHSLQLIEARAFGASAVLLIARALPPARLAELAAEAWALGLDTLVEIRSESELEHALALERAVIGVNNRDLETLEVDVDTSRRLLPDIPRGRIAVVESGVKGVDDVRLAAGLGADAVLVGSALSASANPAEMVRALSGVERNGFARRG
jgi:indole-3-glycerol phosphate synthase